MFPVSYIHVRGGLTLSFSVVTVFRAQVSSGCRKPLQWSCDRQGKGKRLPDGRPPSLFRFPWAPRSKMGFSMRVLSRVGKILFGRASSLSILNHTRAPWKGTRLGYQHMRSHMRRHLSASRSSRASAVPPCLGEAWQGQGGGHKQYLM